MIILKEFWLKIEYMSLRVLELWWERKDTRKLWNHNDEWYTILNKIENILSRFFRIILGQNILHNYKITVNDECYNILFY